MNDQIENFFKHPRMKRNRKYLDGIGFAFDSYCMHMKIHILFDYDDTRIFITAHES